MDAKPQRPRLRVHDENMPPPALPGKTLHQRTKSVPAFSSMQTGFSKIAQAAAMLPTKKVLGEVNANTKILQPAKDDSMLVKKFASVEPLKLAPLEKPATRPSTAKSATLTSHPLASVPEVKPILQEPAKKITNKKSIKILQSVNDGTGELQATVLTQPVTSIPSSIAPVEQITQQTTVKQIEVLPTTTQALLLDQNSDKNYINYLETQVEQLESQYNQGVSLPPYQPPEQAQVQQYYEDNKYDYYDDSTTAHSLDLHGESTGGLTTVLPPDNTEQTKLEVEAAQQYVESTQTQEEIEDEWWDTSMVAEYSKEIFSYMQQLETRMLANPRYMDQQTELQWSMRAVLVDWVVQVHQRFTLLPETLFLAVNYIDRFLSRKIVSLGKLQLVGATALFIAAKFEEVNCPTLSEVIYMVDGGYSADELTKAERFMLSMLQFDLGWPGPLSFLRRVSKADDYDLETRTLAKYLLEVTMMDERFIGCTPSFLAAGAHCLARLMLRKGEWTVHHIAYSGFTYSQLRQLLAVLVECCEDPRKHHLAVYEKYCDKRFKRASSFVQGEMMKGFTLPGPKQTRALGPSLSMLG